MSEKLDDEDLLAGAIMRILDILFDIFNGARDFRFGSREFLKSGHQNVPVPTIAGSE